MSVDYIEYEDYTPDNDSESNSIGPGSGSGLVHVTGSHTPLRMVLIGLNMFICVMGLGGNTVVIWICGWRMKRSVFSVWSVSLALSNVCFCAVLPLELVYMITFHWPFGLVMCKLTSSALFLNMYSSVFLLVLISADRCLLVWFPVWAHKHRSVSKAVVLVVLLWSLSFTLTLPSLIHRQTKVHGTVTQCYTDYPIRSQHQVVALTRFVLGFLVPFLVILFCCSVLVLKLRQLSLRSNKPYKVLSALICSFFCCWVPYHTFVLMELNYQNHSLDLIYTGLKVGSTLAALNTIVSPFLYVFIGYDFKQILKRSLTSRMEEAMEEDLRTSPLRSKSMELV